MLVLKNILIEAKVARPHLDLKTTEIWTQCIATLEEPFVTIIVQPIVLACVKKYSNRG
jgi:hypothetical protein